MGYLVEGILSQKHGEMYKLRKLATRYFLHEGILFKKGYDGDPLWCLGPEEAKEMLKEVHVGECREHRGIKKLYRCILQMGYYWPTMRKVVAEFVKKCHGCQVQANLIHTHLQSLQSMVTLWPFHTLGLDLVDQLIHLPIGTYGSLWPQSISPSGWRPYHFVKPPTEPWQT